MVISKYSPCKDTARCPTVKLIATIYQLPNRFVCRASCTQINHSGEQQHQRARAREEREALQYPYDTDNGFGLGVMQVGIGTTQRGAVACLFSCVGGILLGMRAILLSFLTSSAICAMCSLLPWANVGTRLHLRCLCSESQTVQ